MNEEKITALAISQFESNTGLKLLATEVNPILGTGLWADMRLRLNHAPIELVVGVKRLAAQADCKTLIKQLKMAAGDEPPLLIADFIPKPLALELKSHAINYLDVAGNAYLNAPPFFVLIDGQDRTDSLSEGKPVKPFSATELKVVFALLAMPDLLNGNYGEIAIHANVALGVVGTIMRDLKDQGYLLESGSPKLRQWQHWQKLAARWVAEYPKLRDKHYLGAYSTANKNWWQTENLKKYDAQLGGGFAAVYYSLNAKPAAAAVYLNNQQKWEFLRALQFTKAIQTNGELGGDIKVYSKFWGKFPQQASVREVTHPLITYADLLTSSNPQAWAVANEIAARYFVN